MFNLFCFSNHISSSYNRSAFACCVFCGACELGMRLSLLACNISCYNGYGANLSGQKFASIHGDLVTEL